MLGLFYRVENLRGEKEQKKTVKGFVLGFSTAVIIGGATLTVSAANGTFKDVVAGAWYENAVLWAQEKGIVYGYSDGTFKPNNNITRAELTSVVQNLASEGYIDVDIPLEAVNGYGEPTITHEKFLAIKVGQTTRAELEKLFGQELKLKQLGAPDYELSTPDGSINLRLDQDQAVTQKGYEFGHEIYVDRYPQVTAENFNKLEDNMSFELVSAILGGQGALGFEHLNDQKQIQKEYIWYGTDGSYISMTFKPDGDGLSIIPGTIKRND